MKRRILITVILTFFITILNTINSYAEIVEKEYEGDKGYGIKYVHMDAKGNKYPTQNLKISVQNSTVRQGFFTIDYDSIIIGGDLHVGDSIYLEFVWLADDVALIYTAPSWIAIGSNKVEIKDSGYNQVRSGRNHTRTHATLTLLDSGNLEVAVGIEDGTRYLKAAIKIQNVYSQEAKAEDTVLKEQKELEATTELRGFKKSDYLHFASDVTDATVYQIIQPQILKRRDVIDQIKYTESKDSEYTSYTKASVAKVAQTENVVVIEENDSVYCYTSTTQQGKEAFGWGYKNLIEGHEYTIKYTFVYYPKLDELWYRVTYDDNTLGDTKDGDKSEELDKELLDDISTAEDEVTGVMKAVVDRIGGEKRAVYEKFDDVLSDVGFYTNVNDINSTDAQEVEKSVGKIIAVVSNIGITLSIIISAVLGIKYMIESSDEKAEYKKGMMPYLIGAVMLFGICTIVKILQSIGEKINSI